MAEEEGIIAVGGDLRPERLLTAYANGIFPWYSDSQPILWWSPDPRFVLFPDELRVSKSMRPYFNRPKFRLSYDTAFRTVMESCGRVYREGQGGTWITDDMLESYVHLHEMGFAHSVEVWDPESDELVGGLYGIAIGRVFFGESMFAHASNASKFGFISLVRRLQQRGYRFIDCQQETGHLSSLGGRPIPREDFLQRLLPLRIEETERGKWVAEQ